MKMGKTGEIGDRFGEENKEFHLGHATFEIFVSHLRRKVNQADCLLNIMFGN